MKERKPSFLDRLTGTNETKATTTEHTLAPMHTLPTMNNNEEEKEKDLQDEVDESEEASLAVDMYEADNELVIETFIAGVTPDNLHISVTREMVTIRGKRMPPHGIKDDAYQINELYWGTFSREIKLPYEVNTDGADAVEKYGHLVIKLPKLNASKSAELKVKSSV